MMPKIQPVTARAGQIKMDIPSISFIMGAVMERNKVYVKIPRSRSMAPAMLHIKLDKAAALVVFLLWFGL
jgi:hypothetical protein